METLTAPTKVDWNELVIDSYYETIWAIEEQIKAFDNEEALVGLHCLYENMNKKDKREFRSFLTLLMIHIIKWKEQPQKRSTSWVRTIYNAQKEIQEKREDVPSLTEEYIKSVWQEVFDWAIKMAKIEMLISRKVTFSPDILTWKEVFEDEYYLQDND